MSTDTESSQRRLLRTGMEALGLALPESKEDQLLNYLMLMQKWNRAYNLTAIRDPMDMVRKHLLDSLAILPWVKTGTLLDVGTGAGLPGVPLAIMNPDLEVTLVDSAGKKVRFLQEVKRQLKLENIYPLHQRVEEIPKAGYYTQIISRAFSSLTDFIELTQEKLHPSGEWLAMKGHVDEQEVRGLPEGIEIIAELSITVPQLDEKRSLVVMTVDKIK